MRCCVTGRLEINQVDTGSEMGHIWTGCQSIAELTTRARQSVKFTCRFTARTRKTTHVFKQIDDLLHLTKRFGTLTLNNSDFLGGGSIFQLFPSVIYKAHCQRLAV